MGCGVCLECKKCESAWDLWDGIEFAVADDGSYVACVHPLEAEIASRVLGMEDVPLFHRRLRGMSRLLCLGCWEMGYYALTRRGVDAIRESDLRFPSREDFERYPSTYVPPERIQRCSPFQCVNCRRWGPWLLWGEPWFSLLSLLLLPFSVMENRPAPLPCPRCRRWGLHVTHWIS